MKLIFLSAFGGLLQESGPRAINEREYPPDFRVQYVINKNTWIDWGSIDLHPIDVRIAIFKPTGKWKVLGNNNTAQIYELESM